MARTEIKLNDVYYKLKRLPTQALANQMASKVGQGTSEYGDLTTWSAWVQQDWQDGVGKVKPHLNGGFLYGEVESRVPGQLILPQLPKPVDTYKNSETPVRYVPDTVSGYHTVGTGGYERIGIRFTTPSALYSNRTVLYSFYGIVPAGVSVVYAIYSDSASAPNTLVTSGTASFTDIGAGAQWHSHLLIQNSLSTSTAYWLVIYPTTSAIQIAYGADADLVTPTVKRLASGVWSTTGITGNNPVYNTTYGSLDVAGNVQYGAGFFRFNGYLYAYSDSRVWKYDTADAEWDLVGVITDILTVTGATVWDSRVFFGNGGASTTDYTTMSTAEAFVSTAVNGAIFARHNGYLWRAYLNEVEYSDDGTTWEPSTTTGAPIYVSDTSSPVTGMCGLGDNMYVSTKDGLVCIYPGDFAKAVMPWGSSYVDNGACMVNFEGALYITISGRVMRYTEDGSMQDVWMSRDDDLLSSAIGKVWKLTAVNNWLIALVGKSNSVPTVWAYQNNSWHHMATLPSTNGGNDTVYRSWDVYYDRTTSLLWVITSFLQPFSIRVADYAFNPYNDTSSVFQHNAWVEWDWFDGPILEAPKDYESVTIIGENLDATCYVKVYWKDDDSTGWELLGTCDSNIEEVRWTVAMGTRPNTKRFKLGLLLVTLDGTQTPRIRAVRVKYHLMVSDWFRWNLMVDVSGRSGAYQMLGDGTVNNLTAYQIKDALDALCKRVPSFIYKDVDGHQYEVKITDATFTYDKYEYIEATTTEYFEGVYNIQIEQVTNAAYA